MGNLLVKQNPFRTGHRLFCQGRHTQPRLAEGSSDACATLRRLGRIHQSKNRIPGCYPLGSGSARPASGLGDSLLACRGVVSSPNGTGENVGISTRFSGRAVSTGKYLHPTATVGVGGAPAAAGSRRFVTSLRGAARSFCLRKIEPRPEG